MFRVALGLLFGVAAGAAPAAEFGARLMPVVTDQRPNEQGPLAQADRLAPGSVARPGGGMAAELELRASGHGLTAVATQREERPDGGPTRHRGWVNELYAAGGGDAWQFSAGKRIAGWDVGYGFRPNDVVQQETRRLLVPTTLEGRPLLMAEHFEADAAWTFVLVNPGVSASRRGAGEPALAARAYRRAGSVDAYGFARWGRRTHGSVGAALSWVAGDALELHASARWLSAADTLAFEATGGGLETANPWRESAIRHVAQALVGGTWTNDAQLSVLVEAWWDGTAMADAQWDAWNARNAGLAALAASPAPVAAVAGNLAWQANAFNASTSLRRANLFGRLSWRHEAWEPALDLLLTPADRGRVVTASLGWQGDRVRWDAGWRRYGGPGRAVLTQLPTRSSGYIAVSWSY
ncbi:MAG: hypothetical protein KF788_20125 [Piscinibacter sp.]|nr:hypothetical protein [Piscinibacter sp.]